METLKNSALAALVSAPWCYILPAALSLLSLTGAVVPWKLRGS